MNNMKEVQHDDVIHPDVIKMDNAIKDAYEVMAEIYYKEGYIESVQDIIDSIYVKTPANVPLGPRNLNISFKLETLSISLTMSSISSWLISCVNSF